MLGNKWLIATASVPGREVEEVSEDGLLRQTKGGRATRTNLKQASASIYLLNNKNTYTRMEQR